MVIAASAFPLQWRGSIRSPIKTNPILKPRSPPIFCVADPFVLELAEKLEDNYGSLIPKRNENLLLNLKEKCTQQALSRKWPSAKDEPFRFTDLKFIKDSTISVSHPEFSNSDLDFPDVGEPRIVLIDGLLDTSLSQTVGLPAEVFAGNLSSLPGKYADALPPPPEGEGDLFSALNGIGTLDPAVVFVPEGCRFEKPLHIVYYSRQGGEDLRSLWVSNPRVVVVLEKGAQLHIVEEFRGAHEKSYWTNSVLQVSLHDSARLSHTFIQLQKSQAVHIKWTFVQQGTSSSYNLVETSTGGRLNRHNLQIQQLGPDTVTEVSTFHLAGEHQTQDLHSKFTLNHPRGYSRQLHKCIVMNSSGHAVFDGNVQVNRYAQLTDAGQLSRSLLLAPRATVNVKPNLQIIADDVKCSHGAAISDLEEDQLFYFQARGVDVQTARNALVFSFGVEVMERIPDKNLQKRVENDVRKLLAAEGAIR